MVLGDGDKRNNRNNRNKLTLDGSCSSGTTCAVPTTKYSCAAPSNTTTAHEIPCSSTSKS